MATSATNLALLVVGLGTSILVSRVLGVDARGQFVRWQLWATLVGPLPAVSLAQAVVTYAPGLKGVTLRSVAPLVSAACLAVGTIATLTLIVGSAPVPAVAGGALIAMATVLQGILIALHQRAEEVGWRFNLLRFAPQATALMTMIALATAVRDPAIWFLATSAVQALTVLASALRGGGVASGQRVPQRGLVKEALRLAPVNLASLLQYRADSLAASIAMSPSALGLYSVGAAAQSVTFAAGQSGGIVWFGVGRHRSPSYAAMYSYVVGGAVALGIAFLAEPLVGFLYGADFLPAVLPVRILACAGVLQSVDYIGLHVLMVKGGSGLAVAWKAAHSLVVGTLVVAIITPTPVLVATVSLATYLVVSTALLVLALRASRAGQASADQEEIPEDTALLEVEVLTQPGNQGTTL